MRMKLLLWMFTQHLIIFNLAASETAHDPSWNDYLAHRAKRASSDLWFQPLDKYFEDPSFPGTRVERDLNDDAFSTLQSRISTLARVVTGVTLYNGLVEGTIPVDEAIGELMNTGPIRFEKLEKFNKPKVDDYVEKLKKVSAEMDDNSETLERALSDMARMKEMWNDVGDLSGIPDKTKFDELKVMSSLELSAVQKFDADVAIRKVNGKSGFNAVTNSLNQIVQQAKAAEKAMNGIQALDILEAMTPFYKYVELTKYYLSVDPSPIKNKLPNRQPFKSDIDKLLKLKDGDSTTLNLLDALATSQSGNSRIDRKFTSGLVNGFDDLKHLPVDSKNEWLLNRFGWLELKDGLEEVSKLQKEMVALNHKWKPLKKDEVWNAVKRAATLETKLEDIVDVANIYESVLDQFTKKEAFDFPFPDKSRADGRMKISRAATQMLKKGKAIRKIVEITEEQNDSITKLDASNQASIDAFIMLIEALNPYFQVIKTGHSLKQLWDDVNSDPGAYTTVITADTEAKAFFGALKATSKDFDDVAAAAELAMQFRELKSDTTFVNSIKEASRVALESSAPIKSIRTAMENIKTSSTDKTKMLLQLKGLQTFSKPLGDSVAVMSKMQKILEKKNALIKFVTNGHIVDAMAEEQNILPLTKEIVSRTWVGFEKISQECMSLFGEVKKRKDGVVKPTDDKLESYGPIIEGLGGLNDVDLHGSDRMIAIQALFPISDPKQKTKLNELKTSLAELLPLDMTFARHTSSLPGMSGVLTGIAGVFGSVGPKPTVKPVPIAAQTASPRSGSQAGGLRMSTVETTTEKDNGITTRDLIVGGSCSFVSSILTAAAIFGVQKLQKWRKQLAERKKEKKNSTETAKENVPKGVPVTESSSNTNGTSTLAQSTTNTAETGTTTPNTPRKILKASRKSSATTSTGTAASSGSTTTPIETPILTSTQKATKEIKKKPSKKEESNVTIEPTQASEVSEQRPRKRKLDTEYFEDQNDDTTLGCVKSIENEVSPPKRKK